MSTVRDSQQRYLPDWIILGDNSRAVFLEWLLSGEQLQTGEDSFIWVRYGIRLSISQQGSSWIIETPLLLPQMTLCFPPSENHQSCLERSKRTKYAVLEEFPFRKQTSIDLIQKFESQGHETLVVLMDLPRHQGSTDLIAPGEDLAQAQIAYQSEKIAVSIMQNADSLQSTLHWHLPLYDVWTKKARNHLIAMCNRISEVPYDYAFQEEDWRDKNGPLQVETMDDLFSYQKSRLMKETTLWDRYATASTRYFFPSSGFSPLAPVIKIYKDCLDNPLVFWSLDEDVKDFMCNLKKMYRKSLEREEAKGQYRMKTQLPARLNESTYLSIVARTNTSGTGLNAVFSRTIEDYLRVEVKNYLKERLSQRYQQLEGMIP